MGAKNEHSYGRTSSVTATHSASRAARLGLLTLAVSLGACGGAATAGSTPTTASGQGDRRSFDELVRQFPTANRMNEIAAALPRTVERHDVGAVVPQWTLEAASLDAPATPFDAIADHLVAAESGLRITPAARCAARELARFVAENNTLPNTYLADFIVSRCGSSGLRASIAVQGFEIRGDDARAARELASRIEDAWRASVAGRRADVGVGMARRGNAVFVTLVMDPERELRIELTTAPTPLDGRVVLEGSIEGEGNEVFALTTRGDTDVATCTTTLASHRIHIECPFDASDELETIEVITRAAGRIVPRTGARVVAVARPDAGLVYAEPVVAAHANEGDVLGSIAAAVNAQRQRLGRSALTLEAAQSEANHRAADVFFATPNVETQEQAVLFAMAGWDVTGDVVQGNALAFELPGNLQPERWASYVLRHPFERYALLDPDVSRLAVGVSPGSTVTYAMLSTYELFGSLSPSAERQRVLDTIQRGRSENRRPPVRLAAAGDVLGRWAEAVSDGQASPTGAMEGVAREAGHVQGVHGTLVLGLNDLDRFQLPSTLLEANVLDVAVAHYRAEGAAWGQYIVLIVYG